MSNRSERYMRYRRRVSAWTQRAIGKMYLLPRNSDDTIDHIVPISYGFKHKIPSRLIGSYENLKWVPLNENIQKGAKLTGEAREILKRWGYDA